MRLPAAYLELDPRVIPVRTRVANEEQREKKKRERGKGRKREGKKKNYRSRKLSRFAPPLPLSLCLSSNAVIPPILFHVRREKNAVRLNRVTIRVTELSSLEILAGYVLCLSWSVGRSVDWLENREKYCSRERERERETL